jgi:hypothetical protein
MPEATEGRRGEAFTVTAAANLATAGPRLFRPTSACALPVVACLVVAAVVAPPRSLAAQQLPPVYDVNVDLDGGAFTGWGVFVAPHTQLLVGAEALQSLDRGWGGNAGFTAYLGDRYAARLRVGVTRNGEANRYWPDVTTMLDAAVDIRWLWRVGGLELEAGPTAGFARVWRPIYMDPINGWEAGAGVGAARRIARGFEVRAALDGTLSSFTRPYGSTPSGFDSDAIGHRVTFALGLGYRRARATDPTN